MLICCWRLSMLNEQRTGEQRFDDDLPTATHDPFAGLLRPVTDITLTQQVLFCTLILTGLAVQEVPGWGRTSDAVGRCGTYIHMGYKPIGAASADRQFTPGCSRPGWAGCWVLFSLGSRWAM